MGAADLEVCLYILAMVMLAKAQKSGNEGPPTVMKQKTSGHWPIAIMGLSVAAMGCWTMYQEAMPNLRGGTSAISRLSSTYSTTEPIGLTILSQNSALLDCEKVFRSVHAIEMLYLPVPERERLVTLCGQLANEILKRSPTSSFAWIVRAASSAAQGNNADLNVALQTSQLSGPNEGWLANMRIQVAEANIAGLSAETLADHARDLQVAAAVNAYIPDLARRYVVDEDFRTRMTTALASMRPNEQRRFLSAVRAIITRSGR